MKCCIPFFNSPQNREEISIIKSSSVRSISTTSTDREFKSGSDFNSKQSGSDFNSRPGSTDISNTPSFNRAGQYPSFSSQKPTNLRAFTFQELKVATKNFSRSFLVGEGGFGCVYRGSIKSLDPDPVRVEVAVKQLNRKGHQGHKEWLNEVNVLGIVDHPNLVKLIGYCAEDDERGIQRLLVYEFMPNRSVEDHLSARSNATLSWPMRLKVALDAAKGLTYLHEEMEFQIIFRDLKTSNILLDEDWKAKLSDFGLARQGPDEGLSHVSTAIVGTLGYAAPEYIQTGRLTAKSDIWSYGVVLYELITGRRPIDKNRPRGEQKLLEWVKPYISDARRFRIIVDPRLDGNYDLKSATKLASIANKCLVRLPKARPKMSDVLEMVRKVVEGVEMGEMDQGPLVVNADVAGGEERERRREKGRFWDLRKVRGWEWKVVRRGWKLEIVMKS
ncbi:hypothetical protein LUZ60_006894 [Juncus effusus]|nr:hypothetical protein LUZ60_006894 [Juncus effusus]